MEDNTQNTSGGQGRTFDKALNEDVNDFHLPSNSWTQARNAINNSNTGDLGKLGNEPANLYCVSAPYPVIGYIHIIEDKWAVFSTDNTNSEIGLFIEKNCGQNQQINPAYITVVNDACLKFNQDNLVIGVARSLSTCTYNLYWDDGNNPSRVLEIDVDNPARNLYSNPESTIPWIQAPAPGPEGQPPCSETENTSVLDCDKIRLAKYINPICPRVEKGVSGGNLINGSYFVVMAYAIKGQKISDWYMSNVQGLFDHNNVASSLDVFIDSVDADYDELIVGVGSSTNQQVVVRQAGIYSTRQKKLSFDIIQDTWPAIPIEQLPIMTPIMDKTDAMYSVGDYLLRVGPTSKQDFNYQPLANQIVAKWQSVEYPANYYKKGNNHVGYMRDEVYSYFIQWIYDTGDKSSSYHIPGRPAVSYSIPGGPSAKEDSAWSFGASNALEGDEYVFETYNTATETATFPLPPPLGANVLPDGGVVIAEGYMGYWQSSENYPDNKPQIWNASAHTWSAVTSFPYSSTQIDDYDLCGKPIRHHKFPEDNTSSNTVLFNSGNGDKIRIMGVKFEKVKPPVDNSGQPIPGIIGYEILRGTRNGNRTIIAKGMINNMCRYAIPNSTKNGLFPNYPYNDLGNNPFLSSTLTSYSNGNINANIPIPGSSFDNPYYTFHSPETNFNNPFLSAKEFKLYGTIKGGVRGKYEYSEEHPKEKLITNLSFIISAIGGLVIAAQAAQGQSSKKFSTTLSTSGHYNDVLAAGTSSGLLSPSYLLVNPPVTGVNLGLVGTILADEALASNTIGALVPLVPNATQKNIAYYSAAMSASGVLAASIPDLEVNKTDGYLDGLGGAGIIYKIPMFLNYFSEGTDSIIRLIRAIIRYRDFALRYHSHGFYNEFDNVNKANTFRSEIDNAFYINPEIVSLNPNLQINNLYRQRTVTFETISTNKLPVPTGDNSRSGIIKPSNITKVEDMVNKIFETRCASHYGALKVRIKNQYSQLNNIVQVPVSPCYSTGSSTTTLFGGDTYVNRYTEKNTFLYFYDWLEGQPDGAQLDYTQHVMIPYPKYWANFNQFQTSDFTSSFFSQLATFGQSEPSIVPSSYYVLDGEGFNAAISGFSPNSFRFDVKGWFYLFKSGVRDFFVESEINTAYRDYGALEEQKFYDPYEGSDTKDLFKTSIIKSGNYYKYDFSLSISKMFSNYVSWASSQPISYDPYIAETCYVYKPTRAVYSLPAQYESLKDGWLVFLPSNYNDFDNVVTCIKPVNKSGAMIFFDAASPVQFQGTDQLETGLGTKLTIGDGGLFSQPMQALINVDSSHEYASCQNRLSVINTPAGLYWISQNQGKVFSLQGGIKEVSNMNMKWWFAQYLPYVLTKDFPDFELIDNPVIGIGCQSMYNNQDGILYFSKKDYKLKPEFKNLIQYTGSSNVFKVLSTQLLFKLGDPVDTLWQLYFDDASWTISYDPKTDGWIGYHDWHPSLTLPGKNTFMTTNPNDLRGIWIHNQRCDLYCNYYNIDQPFEVEFMVNTAQDVTSLRSIEYIMEAYKYAPNCYDRFHVLDYNFNEAIIYNTEQTSGLLKLVLNPKQNPTAILQYPIINPTNINVLFSKEENKYRFNQFWDTTKDRGEYYNPTIPGFAQRPIWNTGANGYHRVLNTFNLDYNKAPFQRKKFRHYTTSVLLRKAVVLNQSMNYKMLVMIANTKNLNSPR